MWRSKAGALLLRSLRCRSRTLNPTPLSHRLPNRPIRNPRFFSTHDAANPSLGSAADPNEFGVHENVRPGEFSAWSFGETEHSSVKFDADENVELGEASAWTFDEGDDKGDAFGDISEGTSNSLISERDGAEADRKDYSLGEIAEGTSDALVSEGDGTGAEVAEIGAEQIEKVVSILKGSSDEPIESSLDKLELSLSEEFVVKVIEASDGIGKNLIGFVKWALENEESVKSSRVIELLVQSVKGFLELGKKEAYMLWDLVKELGKEKWVLNAVILNELISLFWKLGKARAGFEVFNKFEEFGCSPDADTYYYTIQALGKRSMFDTAWSVCEKMINSGSLPDSEKTGEIITFFCKGKKVKEAHLVYLMAKEKNLSPPRSSLDFLICGLARSDETVRLAFELLEDYPKGSFKHANKIFGSVVKGLCRVKNVQDAKKLLMRMVESGPAPGNASFNFVINALAKQGELEDAVALMKAMEGRGLRPDVYTYTVVMSGYAKGGLMDEAYSIYCEAKRQHGKLSPATYHVLTRGYCKMEEFDKALECMKEMKEHGVQPNADEYDKMIQSLCLKALDWRAAEKLLEEMKESGLYLKGITRSLISAVKELEEEEAQPEAMSIEA